MQVMIAYLNVYLDNNKSITFKTISLYVDS